MRATSLVVLATLLAPEVVSATWLRWAANRQLFAPPARQTSPADAVDPVGATSPKPTPAPGSEPYRGQEALELLRRQRGSSSSNTWLNSRTCGWYSGYFSSAWTCSVGSSCATNLDNVVACVSGTSSPFYTACLDYAAYQRGACESAGFLTGCCQSTRFPACGTYLWTGGASTRSMFRCFTSSSFIIMNDMPQSVIDNPPTITSSSTISSTTFRPTQTSTSTSSPTPTPPPAGGGGGGNTGAIVGGVVGGVGAVAIIGAAAAFLWTRNRRKSGGTTATGSSVNYGPVPPGDPSTNYAPSTMTALSGPALSGPSPQMGQAYALGGAGLAAGAAGGYAYGQLQQPQQTPSPPPQGVYDPHQPNMDYYAQQQQQQQQMYQQGYGSQDPYQQQYAQGYQQQQPGQAPQGQYIPDQFAPYPYPNPPNASHSPNNLYPPPAQPSPGGGLTPPHSPDPSGSSVAGAGGDNRVMSGQSFGSSVPLYAPGTEAGGAAGSGAASGNNPQMSFASVELETTAPAGHRENPIEMPPQTYR